MIFSKFLVEVLDKLSNEALAEIRGENHNYPYGLDWAIQSWCRKLNLPGDAVINILQEDELKEFTSEVWAKWQQKSGFFNSEDGELKKYINKKLGKTMNRNINTLEFILLFALVMAGIGYVLHLVNQQSKENKDRISKIPSIPSLPHIEKKKEG
ncbi:hypothetical protein [Chroococcidiopsis sp.]|uniref:hypothetical protein n=1 Tax=Chroococcidiopsis sp. TaxID=3088168 RepID=UPI003F378336